MGDGTLRIEWRDFPYLGEESLTAALAGRAAADQDLFWPFAAELYADQAPPNRGTLTADHLVTVAQGLGLDGQRFRTVMEDDATLDAVKADARGAFELGVNGTPTFFVNGQVLVGAQPTAVFVAAIERAARVGSMTDVTPLLWDRFDLGSQRWLRGRAVRLGPVQTHSTSLASGTLFVVIGVLFLRSDGLVGIAGLFGDTTDLEFDLQIELARWFGGVPDWAVPAAVAVAAAMWAWRPRMPGPPTETEDAPELTAPHR